MLEKEFYIALKEEEAKQEGLQVKYFHPTPFSHVR